MEKQNIERFIGLPYKFLGTDFTGVDCIGLCQLFFFEHNLPIVIRDGRPITKDWYLTEPYRLARWLFKNFDKVENIVLKIRNLAISSYSYQCWYYKLISLIFDYYTIINTINTLYKHKSIIVCKQQHCHLI